MDHGEENVAVIQRDLGLPPLDEAMRVVFLEETEAYISRHQNKVAQYIVTCPILDLFLEVEQRPGS